jgi:predicted nucleotidyltransferase component of viral defense system
MNKTQYTKLKKLGIFTLAQANELGISQQSLSKLVKQIFKGGTCLNKIDVGFYRLSEDLDFSIPVNFAATRGERRKWTTIF